MHYEVAEFQKPSTSAAFFEAIDKCQVVPMKELPQVTCSNTGKAFLNSQMSFKITVNNSSDSTEPQQSPHEMSVPLLDLIPKRPSIFERLPILQRTQEFRCPKSSKEYFQQQKHQSMKDNVNQTLSADGLHRVLDTFQENLETPASSLISLSSLSSVLENTQGMVI